jgi:hypothetical protein
MIGYFSNKRLIVAKDIISNRFNSGQMECFRQCYRNKPMILLNRPSSAAMLAVSAPAAVSEEDDIPPFQAFDRHLSVSPSRDCGTQEIFLDVDAFQ